MSQHHGSIAWQRTPHAIEADTYSRTHVADLNGGQRIAVSATPEYKGDADRTDPEQLLLTALASCHMMTFLAIAEARGYRVERYQDNPVAHLEKDADGRQAVTRIELAPQTTFNGKLPTEAELARLHDSAHRNCFIAHSIVAKVSIAPQATAG
ncbi:OsmC family protein [Pseudothauera nasutitermitis]|uniref:OsmC family protein n=1 Tax=Pseudothauera nasutitermitis TaxID=2565930 RepID=A0A4S4B3U8_9RHOO|nr:OsmC family protein [Pseudothauera nasutitermitis]THF65574.1 OsmC family protein [Pseudothauera nasutitermitis]